MAKKRDVTSSPTVTNLPLPISETPLVIDLPDGQKLVIGKMSNGSIIEVATWRGTGRPDSRTNRLMLGMSSASSLAAPTEASQVQATSSIKRKFEGITLPKVDIASLIAKFKSLFEKVSKPVTRVSKNEPEEFTSDLDIDEWLAKLTSKAEKSIDLPKKSPKKVVATKPAKSTKKK
ncbi:unannotated protein [freshwater metagenome]|jgi:hypothetical protein|uniref:Unannotated protein n=1 Tax=freshwater metagenome TaxID=449393 RepID=A0A6J6VR10_9ZZZZ|nr:hypothetical protein [Actinomycetota bacterium]